MHNVLSSRLVPKNVNIKIHKTIILPVVLYCCENLFFTLEEGRKLRVFESMMLRRIFGPKRDEITGKWRRLHKEELLAVYSSVILKMYYSSDQIEKSEMGRTCSTYEGEVHRGFWWESLREKHLEDLGVDVDIILKWISEK